MLRKFPIGLQSFLKIREGGYLYIDKTKIIHHLVDTDGFYFLSRPRRFGKSLLVDTIKQLFKGQKQPFKGLWIEENWDWATKRPVIHFDFSSMGCGTLDLAGAISDELTRKALKLEIELTSNNFEDKFKELIRKAALRGRVVILIDEFDRPIIDFLEDPAQMDANRVIFRSFYNVLNGCE